MIDPASGILLIADPFLKDPNFLRTVVFLCEHKEEGSFGFGGPVQIDSIHFIHQYPNEIPGGQEVIKGVYWGGDFDAVVNLIKNEAIDPNKIRFYIGYSGWGEGQLANEMTEKTWLTVKATRKLIFHTNYEEIWKETFLSRIF